MIHSQFRLVPGGSLELIRRCTAVTCLGHCVCAAQGKRCSLNGNKCNDVTKGTCSYFGYFVLLCLLFACILFLFCCFFIVFLFFGYLFLVCFCFLFFCDVFSFFVGMAVAAMYLLTLSMLCL